MTNHEVEDAFSELKVTILKRAIAELEEKVARLEDEIAELKERT